MNDEQIAALGFIIGLNLAIFGAVFISLLMMIGAIEVLFGTFLWVTR
jgi:hypothetical protein